jgi:hypothetical protein
MGQLPWSFFSFDKCVYIYQLDSCLDYSSRCPKIFGEGLKYELKIFGLTCTIFIFMGTVLL